MCRGIFVLHGGKLLLDQIDNVNSKISDLATLSDAIIASVCDAVSWVYDCSNKVWSISFYGEAGEIVDTISINNPKDNVNESRLVYEEDEQLVIGFFNDIELQKDFVSVEYRGFGRDYKMNWFRALGQVMYENGVPVKYIGRTYDISREKVNKDNSTAMQDSLTGLYRREKVADLIRKEIQNNNNSSYAITIIDVDNFKEVNDIFGKVQGDYILQIISGMVYTNYMSKDIVGRIAGDQFIVFCSDVDEEKVLELAERLMKRVVDNVPYVNSHPVSLSIGVSFGPKDADSYELLYTKADMALLAAKKAGGNKLVTFSDEAVKDVSIGYTMVTMNKFNDEEYNLDKDKKSVNKQLFDFTFEKMTKESDIKTAIKAVFEEVCLFYKLDRAILTTLDFRHEKVAFFARWCRVDDADDSEKRRELSPMAWQMIDEAIGDGFFVYKDGRNEKIDLFRHLVTLNKVPVASLQFPIRDAGEMVGLVTFEAFEDHEFNPSEIETIASVVRLIRSYLLSQQTKHEMEMEAVINKNVMNSQKILFYIIDEDTFEVKYISKYAKEVFPHSQYGCKCYETFNGYSQPCSSCPLINGVSDTGNCVETFIEGPNRWYTLSANHMQGTENDKDVLVCITDVTDFLNRVRSEDNLTVADSFDRFIVDATTSVKKNDDKYSVICTGIRRFSKINDEYGYVIGDEILKRYAELVKEDLLEGEYFCRIKGDDFALLAKQLKEDEYRKYFTKYTETLNAEFRQRFPLIDIQCFVGIYDVTENDTYINQCVDNALKARRIAAEDMSKSGGLYVYSNELIIKEKQEKEINDMIKEALADNRFKVYFQPKVNIEDGSIVGAEALVRMVDKEGKLVSPGLFIPVSEKSGMVVDIDEAVYEQTFALMSEWKKLGKNVPLISVNVSRLHLIDDSLPEMMKGLVDKYGLSTKDVELEITESVFFEDTERLIYMIQRLKDVGFVISMDDFGSGYSTLNFMKKLPVDVIKIDGGFFMRNEMDNKSKAIISAIIQLTQNLEFKSVSEGVETKEQVEFIKAQGGKCVQGYYYYKPLPSDEFEKLI